ncbi:MAG: GGDEF domain-containing protein [Desulfarculus sp.]|nr:GGDEF domain-containing protein [Desulfarculus sp.]
MSEEVMTAIIRKCLHIDSLAAEMYRCLSEGFAGAEVARFWRRMAREEREHVEFWQVLLALAQQGLVPQVFEDPYQVAQELEEVEARVRLLEKQCLEPPQVNLAFVVAYRLEFYLLHPAFAALFHYAASLGRINGLNSPLESYEAHIHQFLEALGRWGSGSPELELAGEVLVRLWRENKLLAQQSTTDQLTQVLNRRGFFRVVQPLLHLAQRHGDQVGVLMVDLDGFKEINDSQGHQAGDLLLRQVAGVIARGVRSSDIVGRYGGDEFIVYLGPVDQEGLGRVAEKLRLAMQGAPWEGLAVTVSLGGALGPVGGGVDQALHGIIQLADQRLLAAKRAGRNQALTQESPVLAPGLAREIW